MTRFGSKGVVLHRAALAVVLLAALAAGCSRSQDPAGSAIPTAAPPALLPPVFRDVTAEWGLAARHDPGDLADFEMPQIMAGGGALFDFDRDGRLDIYLVDSVSETKGEPAQLFRSLNADNRPLVDVSVASRLARQSGGMGAAVGDVNGDGFGDLYLTCFGRDRLYVNNGDGTFTDGTQAAGLECPAWGTAACFCDVDADGDPDLLVVNYVEYRSHEVCQDAAGLRDFCGPSAFAGTVDRLFLNTGIGISGATAGAPRFDEATGPAGFLGNEGKGLGVVCQDLTGDGRIDFYVANDMESNHFWIGQPGGTWQDEAILQGVAFNQLGEAEASMGVCAADFTGEGTCDLFMTHLRGQTNTMYVKREDGIWSDRSAASGTGVPSLPYTGFGVAAIDLEHDGDVDLLIANGGVKREELTGASTGAESVAFAEPNQILVNDGSGRFVEWHAAGDPFLSAKEISRGLAAGDVDGDGDVDLLLTNCAGPARLYLNETEKSGSWLDVRLVGTRSDRDAVAAQVTVSCGNRRFLRVVDPCSGYLTSSDVTRNFGLPAASFDRIDITWPSGDRETYSGGAANRSLLIIEGSGQPVELPLTTF